MVVVPWLHILERLGSNYTSLIFGHILRVATWLATTFGPEDEIATCILDLYVVQLGLKLVYH